MNTQSANTTEETNQSERELMLDTLQHFIRQRPGFEWANYDSAASYRADTRRALRDLHDAEDMLRAIRWRTSCTFSPSTSGRLTWEAERKGWQYVAGQYFPTEFRAAACSLLASALWGYWRENLPKKTTYTHNQETGEDTVRYDGLRACDWIRRQARRELGARIANRWFN